MVWNSRFFLRAVPLGLALLSTAIATSEARAQGGVTLGGFVGSYSNTATIGAPVAFVRHDPRIDFVWKSWGPGGSISPAFQTSGWTAFNANWEGHVIPDTSE